MENKYGCINITAPDGWRGTIKSARDVIERVSRDEHWKNDRELNQDERFNLMLAPAGFLKDLVEITNNDHIPLKDLEDRAIKVVRDFLEYENCVNIIGQMTRFLALGIDMVNGFDKKKDNLAEFVFIIDLKNWTDADTWWVTGKSYPNSRQEGKLKKYDTGSHFRKIDGLGATLILVCHDLTTFNPRVNEKRPLSDWRRETKKGFSDLVKRNEIDQIIHLYHIAKSPRTWTSSWNKLIAQSGSKQHEIEFIGCGVFSSNHDMESILKKTRSKDLDIIDFKIDAGST